MNKCIYLTFSTFYVLFHLLFLLYWNKNASKLLNRMMQKEIVTLLCISGKKYSDFHYLYHAE